MSEWVIPANSRSEIRRAGKVLKGSHNDQELQGNWQWVVQADALDILNNWKAAHELPLHSVRENVLNLLEDDCDNRTIVSRRKRTESILLKLEQLPKLDLSRMQDLVGFRIVFRSDDPKKNNDCVHKLKNKILSAKWVESKPSRFTDYNEKPRDSGYRSNHIIFKYISDKNKEYRNMQVELQIRTKIQHIWATAVETVGMFRRSHLKQGIGDEKWLEFFRIMSKLMQIDEDPYPDIHNERRRLLTDRLRDVSDEIEATRNLKLIALQHSILEQTFEKIEKDIKGDIGYVLMTLELGDLIITNRLVEDSVKGKVDAKLKIKSYPPNEAKKATIEYGIEEKRAARDTSVYVLLAKGDDLKDLRNGFPNYFADINEFIEMHRKYLAESYSSPQRSL